MAALQSALMNVMVGAARKGARSLRRDFGEVENLQVSRKGPADFVSQADKAAEAAIVAELMRARPDFGILAEEGGVTKGKDPDQRWIIDPLDGTTNFLHGLPHFAISIALEVRGRIVAGVIYDPIRDEMFMAERGRGAFVNDRRLRVSARRDLTEALLATGLPYAGKPGGELILADLVKIMPRTAGVRRYGSAALDLAYVAAGRYDGYWEYGLQAWDVAAGVLLVREAGGLVTEVNGGEKVLNGQSILAANGELHDPLMRLLRDAKQSVTQAEAAS